VSIWSILRQGLREADGGKLSFTSYLWSPERGCSSSTAPTTPAAIDALAAAATFD